ncbi:MAG: SMP-30/gluconolactonase/LRE family protein [Byssovorax sp.]
MIKVPYFTRFAVVLSTMGASALAASAILTACSGGQILPPPLPDGGGGAGGSGVTTGDMATTDSSSASGTGGGATGTGGAMPAMLTWVTKLDPSKFELPEGLAMNAAGDTAYVSIAPTGQILQIKVSDGTVSPFGSVPQPPAMKGFALGVQTDKAGDFYVAVASFDPATYQPGIYKIPAAGGAATLFAKDAAMNFPNGMTFNAAGDLFVTDSIAGSIYKITSAGVVTKWLTDPLISGDTMAKCPSGQPFPIGANGIVISGTDFYVTNTDKASMAKIAIKGDGTAGAVTDFVKTDCMAFGGPDGLSVDADGTFLVASNGINSITRVGTDGKVTLLAAKTVAAPLDAPASTWITNAGKAGATLFVTNSGISTFLSGGMAKPGLFKLAL